MENKIQGNHVTSTYAPTYKFIYISYLFKNKKFTEDSLNCDKHISLVSHYDKFKITVIS